MAQKKLDPWTYGDITTTALQVLSAVGGIIAWLLTDQEAALLGLTALLGGRKGALALDILKAIVSVAKPVQKSRLPMVLFSLLSFSLILSMGCASTGITKAFVMDSHQAIMGQGIDYLSGCQQVTIAPAFSIDWTGEIIYGGGIFAGCEKDGRMAQFMCHGTDGPDGKLKIVCQPLTEWTRK